VIGQYDWLRIGPSSAELPQQATFMKLGYLSVAVLALALVPTAFCADPPAEKDVTAYYPLKVGNAWTYKVGENKVVMSVVRIDDGVAHIESSSAGGKITLTETLQTKADGIFRQEANGKKVVPDLKFLALPSKNGETWEINSKIGDETMKGKFKVEEIAELTVGGKKYEKVIVVTGDDLDANGTKLNLVTHYARGVGMIKQSIKAGDQTILLELEEFKAGK
jgi:hypothetical protein